MTTRPISKLPLAGEYAHIEPLPDPPHRTDMKQHEHVARYDQIIRAHFRHRIDVLVSGSGYLCFSRRDRRNWVVPDCVVAFGVTPQAIVQTNGWVISEVGKPPNFVLEVASRTTGLRDYTVKREIYAGYGVGEQWRMDPSGGRYHDAPLAGDRLVDGVLVPIPVELGSDGILRGYSEALGLELHWVEGWLRFWNPETGDYLPEFTEALDGWGTEQAARRYAESQRDAEQAARRYAESQRDAEQTARRDAEERVRLLEAELRRRQSES